MPRYHLRGLLGLVTACALAVGLLRGVLVEREPLWGFYLLGLTSICAGIAASVIVLFDPKPR